MEGALCPTLEAHKAVSTIQTAAKTFQWFQLEEVGYYENKCHRPVLILNIRLPFNFASPIENFFPREATLLIFSSSLV